jgi:hypothetical protein
MEKRSGCESHPSSVCCERSGAKVEVLDATRRRLALIYTASPLAEHRGSRPTSEGVAPV